MKATFIEDAELRLGLSFEAETPEERLLLRAFSAQAQDHDNRMQIRGWRDVAGARGGGIGAVRLYLDGHPRTPPSTGLPRTMTGPLDPDFLALAEAVQHHTTPPVANRGRLIVLEGLDGAGTTTQARRLVELLRERGQETHLTREPSDNPIGRLLREFLVGGHTLPTGSVRQETFALLFAADRIDHVQREVEPELAAGRIVVSDRWYHSSFAYQGQGDWQDGKYGRCSWIAILNQHALRPDLTIFLRVPPEVAADRRIAAGRAQELFEDLDTQRRVNAQYEATIEFLRRRGERVEVLDGECPMEEIGAQIMRLVDQDEEGSR